MAGAAFLFQTMKKLIELIEHLNLSVLLAIESLFPNEGISGEGYMDGRLLIQSLSESWGSCVRALSLAETGSHAVYLHEEGDWLLFSKGPSPWIEELNRFFHAMGAEKTSSVSVGGAILKLQADDAWNRLKAIDNLMCVHRFINEGVESHGHRVDNTLRVMQGAQQWSKLRLEILERGETRTRADQLRALADKFVYERFSLPSVTQVEVEHDPRGSAMRLHREDGRQIGVTSCNSDWRIYPPDTNAFSGSQPVAAKKKVKAVPDGFAVAPTAVPHDIRQILAGAVIEGKELKILQKLTPKTYGKVNDLLIGLGGRWHTGKQSHVFDESPNAVVAQIVDSGFIATAKDYEFFPTPESLVQTMIEESGMQPGMTVMEPHGGSGAIASAMANVVGHGNVICYELWELNVKSLTALGFKVEQTDFLHVTPERVADVVLLNPPFSHGKDIAHVTHALKFLKPGGHLGAITSVNWRHQDTKANLQFRSLMLELGAAVTDVPAGTFHESGTDVPTLRISLNLPAHKAEETTVAVKPSTSTTETSNPAQLDLLSMFDT